MPQTGLGVGTKDALNDLLEGINTSPKLHRLIDTTLDGDGRNILIRFLTTGYRLLASDFMSDDTWLTTHFPLCENSKACLLSLVAFQAAVDPEHEEDFDRFYDQALTQFTKETCGLGKIPETSLFFAGLFMCTINLSRLMPYTNHLNAIIAMVMGWLKLDTPIRSDTQEFLSLLGFLDLQTHTINRMTPQNYVWYTYCRGQHGVHRISGLPYSLMDLLSSVHLQGTEQNLLSWTPPPGAPAQQLLWKASRFAGILSVYELRLQSGSLSEVLPSSLGASLSPQVLVHNILGLIQQCVIFVPSESGQFKQTLTYPLVMAASQRSALAGSEKDFICQTIRDMASERNHFAYQGILGVVQEFWKSKDSTIEETARRLDVELPLC